METVTFAIIAAALLAYGLISRRVENLPLTAPMIFLGLGVLAGDAGLKIVHLDFSHGAIRTIAEITLVLVLFMDAARIDVRNLRLQHRIPVRLLAIGMPLTVAAGAGAALILLPDIGVWTALLIAAILAPTDAALGQAVIANTTVPQRIRQALNVESGLNDGVALPLVVFFLCGAIVAMGPAAPNYAEHANRTLEFWLTFVGLQLVLGPLIGGIIGWLGGRLIDRSASAGWMSEAMQGIAAIGLALLAYAAAELSGGNGFIAAFVAGLVFGATARHVARALYEFAEGEGQLLTLLTFLLVGAVLMPAVSAQIDGRTVIYALLSLTVIRIVPVVLSLAGLRLQISTLFFLGWFGPRGLASVLFALLVVEQTMGQASSRIMAVVLTTVVFSVVLHGLTAAPFAAWYGRRHEASEEAAEMPESETVPAMPTRFDSKAD